MVLGVGLGISISNARVEPIQHKPVSNHDVYVDISKLIRLHPSWQAVETMRATVADVRASSSGVQLAKADVAPNASSNSIKGESYSPVSVSRRSLEAEVCKSAASALQQLESDQWAALQTRLQINRSAMLKSAEAEIRLQRHEVYADAAEQMKNAANLHSNERLNTQMRVTALRSASKTPGIGPSLKPKLDEAEAELDRINSETSSQLQKITAQTQEKVLSIRSSYEAKIDAALSVYETGEGKRIKNASKASHKEVLDEVCIFDALASPEEAASVVSRLKPVGSVVNVSPVAEHSQNNARRLVDFSRQTSRLEMQIRDDVARAIRQMGADKGMRVVFSRRDGVPDKTREFSALMREQAWSVCRPIFSEAYGS